MACALNTTTGTADYLTATATIDRLTAWAANASMKRAPFFAAAGFQGACGNFDIVSIVTARTSTFSRAFL